MFDTREGGHDVSDKKERERKGLYLAGPMKTVNGDKKLSYLSTFFYFFQDKMR